MRPFPVAIAMLVSIATTASAADPAYVGTWGKDAAECAVPQEEQGAPLKFSADGYDQHEVHCKFGKVTAKTAKWDVDASCSAQGDTLDLQFSLAVDGEFMTMTDEFGSRNLMRCK